MTSTDMIPLPKLPRMTHYGGEAAVLFPAEIQNLQREAMRVALDSAIAACQHEASLWRGEQDITDFRLCVARIRALRIEGEQQ